MSLEIRILLEEHCEADYRPVYQQAANNTHRSGRGRNKSAVSKEDRQRCRSISFGFGSLFLCNLTNAHHYEEAGEEASKVDNTSSTALHEVVAVRSPAAEPVRHWRNNVGGYDEERQVVLPDGRGQDDEKEADGEDLRKRVSTVSTISRGLLLRNTHKRQRSDGFKTGHRHCDGCWRSLCQTRGPAGTTLTVSRGSGDRRGSRYPTGS